MILLLGVFVLLLAGIAALGFVVVHDRIDEMDQEIKDLFQELHDRHAFLEREIRDLHDDVIG